MLSNVKLATHVDQGPRSYLLSRIILRDSISRATHLQVMDAVYIVLSYFSFPLKARSADTSVTGITLFS